MRVATYGRRVGSAPLPDARLTQAETPESEGAGLYEAKANEGRAIEGLGGAVEGAAQKLGDVQTKIRTDAVDQANTIALLAASNKLDEGVNQILYDPQNGALTLKGKDAMGTPESTAAAFNTLASGIEGELTTDKQRLEFQRLRAAHEQNLDITIRRHVFQETQDYEKNELGSFLQNKKDNAVANALDPRRAFDELGAGVAALKDSFARQGIGPEQQQQQLDAFTTATHVGVIDNLLAQNKTGAAKTYFEETKGQIAGDAAAKIQKAIAAGELRGQAQQETDKILAKGGSLSSMLDDAKKLDDPELRDEVSQRLEHADAVKEKAERDQEASMLNDAYNVVSRTKSVDAISPATWLALGTHQPALREYANRLAKGDPAETDSLTFYALMQQAGDEPATFAAQNLLNYRNKLDDADFKRFADLQLALKNGDRKTADQTLGGARTAREVVDNTLQRFGFTDLTPKDAATGRAIAQLRTLVDQGVANFEQATGKKAKSQDVQGIADRILSVPSTVPGSWWGILPLSSSSFSTTQKKLADIRTVADVPKADQDEIKAARTRRGLTTSDADILDAYLAGLAGVYGGRK